MGPQPLNPHWVKHTIQSKGEGWRGRSSPGIVSQMRPLTQCAPTGMRAMGAQPIYLLGALSPGACVALFLLEARWVAAPRGWGSGGAICIHIDAQGG